MCAGSAHARSLSVVREWFGKKYFPCISNRVGAVKHVCTRTFQRIGQQYTSEILRLQSFKYLIFVTFVIHYSLAVLKQENGALMKVSLNSDSEVEIHFMSRLPKVHLIAIW